MEHDQLVLLIERIIISIERHLPEYLADKPDRDIAEGNVAVCIIDHKGQVYGKMFGADKNRQRASFRIAWIKASQVWITGIKTGKYEELVFTGQIDERKFGIIRPDFIGWEGGQPVDLDEDTKISVGFSGFRGTSDLEIVKKAVSDGTGISIEGK